MTADSPIATYTERLPQVCRMFRLFQDRVEVEAKWTLGKRFRMSVALRELSGRSQSFHVKNRWFPRAVMIGATAVAAALVLARPGYPEALRHAAGYGWPVAGIAFAVALLCMPRRQFVHFPRADGRPGLDLCKAGPDRARFESFVEEIRRRIPRA